MPKLSKLFSGLRTSLTNSTSELRRHSQSDLESAQEGALQLGPQRLGYDDVIRASAKEFANMKLNSQLARRYHEEVNDKGPSELLQPELSINDLFEYRLNAGELSTLRTRHCIEAMFTTLASRLSCCNGKHFMQLKLTGFVRQFDREGRPFFDLYLSNGDDGERSCWAESKCTFTRRLTYGEEMGCNVINDSILAGKKASVLLIEPAYQDLETQKNTQESLRPIQFGISDERGSSAIPATSATSVTSLTKQDESTYDIRRVLNAGRFSTEDRDWLCLNLALSLLHMSGRLWNRAIWYSDNPNTENGIFFLRDPITQEIVDKRRPYMSWRLQEESDIQKPTKELCYDTQLLSFARLLIEIHKWERLHLTPEPESEEELRSRLLGYIDVNFNSERELEFISALRGCLIHAGYVEPGAENRSERLQAYIFENIVKPLHSYLGNPPLPKSTWEAMPSYDLAVLDGLNYPNYFTSLHDAFIYSGKLEEKSLHEKKFWKDMQIFTEKYISPLAPSDDVKPWPGRKVRVAIIDTGVRKEDAEIAAAEVTQRIRGYRNFTSSDLNDCEDKVKHGTMVARLFLTVAPQAELYIAKVADEQEMLNNQLHRITEAIKWAVLECDVDIISMSLLLPKEHSGIDQELTKALSPSSQDAKRKLVFAAARNFGLYKQRAFPARKEGVIAVHAADGSGNEPRFVPNPESISDPESKLNLSTLGENIKMRWPDSGNPGEMKDIYISGSSYATPIAAGIAANVLEFARHRLNMNEWIRDEIYSHRGMTKILKAMSCRRGGYDFVHPLAFWERAFHGGIWETQMLPHDNPLNSILFDQPWAISLEPQSDFTKGDIRAGTWGPRAGATKRTPKVDMITDDEYETETSSSNPSNLCSTQATEDYRAENCIAKHPRELPLHVAFRIADDDDHQQGCDIPSSRCSDRDRFEHEDLPKLGLEDLAYFEVKTTAELPFEIPKSSQYERPTIPTIVPVKAKSPNTRRQFVMKKINLESELGEGADERMKRLCLKEAMTLWHARHQHVIEIAMAFTFEGDNTDDMEGPYFGIIMELAEQGDISRHLACQRPAAERAKISTWFACLANAIAYIHSIGIRHRDIKPGNILLKKDGSVKLADFGISKMRLGRTSSTTTPEGPRANTPRYAAPEVGEGGTRGRQADIFALGAVFLEMLIAHSFKHLRPQLSEKLKPSRLGARFGRDVSGPAYAPSLRKIHDWINEIQADLTCGEEHWHRTILSLCLKMTSEIREARPSAEEVYSIISGSESLQNEAHEAGSSCNCDVASVQTESQKLIEACQRLDGYDEVVSLLENENNLQTKGAIQQAASHGRLSVVQQFLARGADVNQLDYCNQTALHCAAACGHANVAKLLLEYGAKIDIKDEEEQLPLHCASGQGQLEMVETLLAQDITGATLLSTDCYEQMPLHCAAKRGFTNVVRFLIGRMNSNYNNDNDVVKTDARQRTALHLAAGYGSEAVVRLLLDKVTDKGFVDSLDETGMTALHWATIGRQRNGSYTKVMEVLLERGADVNIRGGAGYKTAINHARDNRDEERIAVLLRADKIAR